MYGTVTVFPNSVPYCYLPCVVSDIHLVMYRARGGAANTKTLNNTEKTIQTVCYQKEYLQKNNSNQNCEVTMKFCIEKKTGVFYRYHVY